MAIGVTVLKLVFFLLILAAAVYLAVASQHAPTGLRVAAVIVVVAMPAMTAWQQTVSGLTVTSKQRRKLELTLRAQVIELIRAREKSGPGLYDGDVTEIGFHVWVVPRYWRKVIPEGLRRWVAERLDESSRARYRWRPRLVCVALYGIQSPERTKVRVRRGVGIIGTCLKANHRDEIFAINWERPDRKACLDGGRTSWEGAGADVTYGLAYSSAKQLAERYGQAAAIVLRGRESLEAIGCVTIDLPHGGTQSIEDREHPLLQHLRDCRDVIKQEGL